MCGIAGYFSVRGFDVERGRALLERMANALEHRGPDDRGIEVFEHCGLASTRLSIVDLEGGHMPLFNERRSIALAYNGEIYNHNGLRGRLVDQGHQFSTRSDGEPIVHLYEDLGPDLASELAGMFAFALWDEDEKRLLLGRDRFGIKPLFIAKSDDDELLFFASEAKAILATGRVTPRLDKRAVRDVLSCGYAMPDRTMFEGITQIAPGSWMLQPVRGSQRTQRYWRVPYPSTAPARMSAKDATQSFLKTFDDVTKEHLAADVSVGSYLSGGIDSVAVAARAARQLDRPLQTFSMVFRDADASFDESRHSDIAAAAIASNHTRVTLTGIDEADYRGTIRAMEAPQIHTVAFCLYQLSRAVRDAGLKVVLSGEGADETLAGYRAFRLARFRRVFGGRLKWIRNGLMKMMFKRRRPQLAASVGRWWGTEDAARSRYGVVPPWFEQWWLLHDATRDILTDDARAFLDVDPLPEGPSPSGDVPISHLHRDLAFEQATRLDGWVLVLGDRLTMAHSVEARVPFLDHRLVELEASLPPNLLLRRFTEKYLLRRAMKNLLPDELRTRSKRAFTAPINRWLIGDDRPDYVREALSPDALARVGLFDPEAIDRTFITATKGGLDGMAACWAINAALGLQMFASEFDVTR